MSREHEGVGQKSKSERVVGKWAEKKENGVGGGVRTPYHLNLFFIFF